MRAPRRLRRERQLHLGLVRAFSVIGGTLLALAGLSANPALRWINRIYVEVFRAIPLLVLLLWIYYGLPTLLGITFPVFWAGLVTLALSDAAFEAEIFRAGIQSVPKGQREAAHTLGLSRWHTFRRIVLPQAIRYILPALGNQFIYVLKMSSLVSVIGFQELTRRANDRSSRAAPTSSTSPSTGRWRSTPSWWSSTWC